MARCVGPGDCALRRRLGKKKKKQNGPKSSQNAARRVYLEIVRARQTRARISDVDLLWERTRRMRFGQIGGPCPQESEPGLDARGHFKPTSKPMASRSSLGSLAVDDASISRGGRRAGDVEKVGGDARSRARSKSGRNILRRRSSHARHAQQEFTDIQREQAR